MSILTVYFRFLVGSAIIFRIFFNKRFYTLYTRVCSLFLHSKVPNTKATGPLAKGGGVCGSHICCSGKGPHKTHSAVSCAYPFPLRNEACPHAGMYVWQKKKTVKVSHHSSSRNIHSSTFLQRHTSDCATSKMQAF